MAEEILEKKKLKLDSMKIQNKDMDISTFRSRMKSYSERKSEGMAREKALELLYKYGIYEENVTGQKAQDLVNSILEKEEKYINLKEIEFDVSLADFTNILTILLNEESTKKGKYNKISFIHKEFAFKYFYSEDPKKFIKQRIKDSHTLKKYESPNKYQTLVNKIQTTPKESFHKKSLSMSPPPHSYRKVNKSTLERLYQDHKAKETKINSLREIRDQNIKEAEHKLCTFRPEISKKSKLLAANHASKSVQRVCRSCEKKKEFDLSTTPAKNHRNHSSTSEKAPKKSTAKKGKLLFFIDVKIKNDKNVKLSIFDNENPEMTVQRFGLMNGLTLQQKKKLLENVKKFLELESQASQQNGSNNNEIENEEFNEDDDEEIL